MTSNQRPGPDAMTYQRIPRSAAGSFGHGITRSGQYVALWRCSLTGLHDRLSGTMPLVPPPSTSQFPVRLVLWSAPQARLVGPPHSEYRGHLAHEQEVIIRPLPFLDRMHHGVPNAIQASQILFELAEVQ